MTRSHLRHGIVGVDMKSVAKDYMDGGQIITALHATEIKLLEGEITVILGECSELRLEPFKWEMCESTNIMILGMLSV